MVETYHCIQNNVISYIKTHTFFCTRLHVKAHVADFWTDLFNVDSSPPSWIIIDGVTRFAILNFLQWSYDVCWENFLDCFYCIRVVPFKLYICLFIKNHITQKTKFRQKVELRGLLIKVTKSFLRIFLII